MNIFLEDSVRDYARDILKLDNPSTLSSGVGQITTFKQLGFKDSVNKPDGWFLPENTDSFALILETKSSDKDLTNIKYKEELKKNVSICMQRYSNVIGILYNKLDTIITFNNEEIEMPTKKLQDKEFYFDYFKENQDINKQLIYKYTKTINDILHFKFGIKNYNHRMIFTACCLCYVRETTLPKNITLEVLHTTIQPFFTKYINDEKFRNLQEQFNKVTFTKLPTNDEINTFISLINNIANHLNSKKWQGEDITSIFFNEFNRYKGKSEAGQVFTPEHIASLIYKVLDINTNDVVLDPTCGSGTFLVKTLHHLQDLVGLNTIEDKTLGKQLFGIEFDAELCALANANMLLHKRTDLSLKQLDASSNIAAQKIKNAKITRVLSNPPYENKNKCMEIVENVLDNVESNALCAFILPDRKLVTLNVGKKLIKKHRLLKIIKLPDIFAGLAGISTSIFIFKAHEPQNNHEIFCCYIEDDAHETKKNQGRHDIKNIWKDTLEPYWVNIINKYDMTEKTACWISPDTPLCYPIKDIKFELTESDINRTILSRLLFEKQFGEKFNLKLTEED